MLTHPKVTKQKHKSHFSIASGTKNAGKTENYLSEIENEEEINLTTLRINRLMCTFLGASEKGS